MWLERAAHRTAALAMQLRSRQRPTHAVPVAAAATRASSTSIGHHDKPVVGAEAASSEASPPKKKARTSKPAATVRIAQTSVDDSNNDRILHRYPTLVPARLLRRYKRFLADVVLAKAGDDERSTPVDESDAITIYCPNTGPMIGLLDIPNTRVQLSKSDDPKRKYAYTLEMVRVHNGERNVWVGVHSTSANYMVERAITAGWFAPQLGAFDVLQREVSYAKNSRVDFVLSRHDADGDVVHQKYVEVKSVTLAWPPPTATATTTATTTDRCAVFPDTVSTRAQKHVTELIELMANRKEANDKKTHKTVELSGAIIFVVQRDDCESFMPSLVHDATFAQLCAEAEAAGIQLLPYLCRLEPDEHGQQGHVRLLQALPLHADRATPGPIVAGKKKTPKESAAKSK